MKWYHWLLIYLAACIGYYSIITLAIGQYDVTQWEKSEIAFLIADCGITGAIMLLFILLNHEPKES